MERNAILHSGLTGACACSPRRAIALWVFVAWLLPASPGNAGDGDDVRNYFQSLRLRGLFVVAEHYANQRLQQPDLDAELRGSLVVELSRTFCDHAWYTSSRQQADLWSQAQDVIHRELRSDPAGPEILQTQLAFVAVAQARMLRWEWGAVPEDQQRAAEFRQAISNGLKQLEQQRNSLSTEDVKGRGSSLSPFECKQLAASIDLELGHLYQWRAEVQAAGSADRASDLLEADAAFQRSAADSVNGNVVSQSWLGRAHVSRLKRDFEQARESCAKALKISESLSPVLRDSIDACRVLCWLDEGVPVKAAQYLLQIRQTRHVLSGELWYLQLQTFLAMRQAATERGDQAIVENVKAEAELVLQRVNEQVGGAWSRFCRLAWERDQSRHEFGPELDRLVRLARSEYLNGDCKQSLNSYSAAIQLARDQAHTELAQELAYIRGSILLEAEDFSTAADEFARLAQERPAHDRTASSHLLMVYAIGRMYQQQPTQARRLAYTDAIAKHLQSFATDPTVNDAKFMLAQLEDQRRQTSKALPLYYEIPADHPRYLAATAAAARCSETILKRLQSLQRDTNDFQSQTVEALSRRAEAWLHTPATWDLLQLEITVRLARIYLTGRPVNHAAAHRLLQQVDQAVVSSRQESGQIPDGWKLWVDAAVPLKLVALAGTGHSQDAHALLASYSMPDPQAGLALVSGLEHLSQGPETKQFVDLTELLVLAVHKLESQRRRLTPAEQQEFDLARARAYLMTGRLKEGLLVVQGLETSAGDDVAELLTLAQLTRQFSSREIQQAALRFWQKLESLEKPGSSGWLTARAGAIEANVKLGETAEAKKLLRVTRLLYPKVEDASQREAFQLLSEQLESQSPGAETQ